MEDQWGSVTTNSSTHITSQRSASIVALVPKTLRKESVSHVASKDHMVRGIGGNVALFLLKVAALETTRRLSRAKCPFAWHTLQAFQFLCYPPFKWVQRWAPFKGLVQSIQMFSQPLLFLSIATAFTDKSEKASSPNNCDDSVASAMVDKETPSEQPCTHTRNNEEFSNCSSLESWLVKLYEELENQGINLPQK